ncbi:MAG: helix-turn-helix domain-containing protein [Coprobacillus sp.]
MKLRENYTCPLELTHDMLRGKWKFIILWRLRLGPTSLSQLERDIEGINQKMLIEQLNELISFDLIKKHVFEGYPLKVEYFLDEDKGKRILDALTIMQSIGIDYMKENGMEDILREKGVI